MKSIQIDLSCAGESDCDRAGGGGGGGVQRPVDGWCWWWGVGQRRRAKKNKKENKLRLYMGHGWRDDLCKSG